MAGATNGVLRFEGSNDPGVTLLDNVVLAAVPEPATVALFATGVLVIALATRRRRE